ncbi:MAG: hypothetical protein ABSD41_06565, partial [Candidatus Bathyarchaeia archaeon]
PTSLSPTEQAYWSKIESLTNDLLHELDSGGWLKNKGQLASTSTHKALGQMLEFAPRFNGHSVTAKAMSDVFADPQKAQQFTDCLVGLGVGFTKDNVANTWIYDVFSMFIESSEMLKNHLLIILRTDRRLLHKNRFKVRMTLGQLFKAIEEVCPKHGAAFTNEVNVELRNAFSHGLYWMKRETDQSITFFRVDELGGKEISTPLSNVVTTISKQLMLTYCVEEVLGNWANAGSFRS